MSSLLFKPILQDHLVNNLSTEHAPPPQKFFTDTIEFFEDHNAATSMTFHNNLLLNITTLDGIANFVPKESVLKLSLII